MPRNGANPRFLAMGFTVLGYRACRCRLSLAPTSRTALFPASRARLRPTPLATLSAPARLTARSKPKGLAAQARQAPRWHDWAKLIGVITRLEAVGDALRIEAQLNLDIGYVRDLHSSIVHDGGLSFSVGFALEDFGGAVGDEQPDRLLWQQEGDASRLPIRHEAEWRAAPARADLDLAVALDRPGQGPACRPESAATLRRTSQTYARDHLSRCR
jgi:hypothetical protein